MRLRQFFLHLFEKPTQRSLLNASICYLLIIALFTSSVAILRMAMPAGDELNPSILLITIFVIAPFINLLSQQAKEWWHPKNRRDDDRHWR